MQHVSVPFWLPEAKAALEGLANTELWPPLVVAVVFANTEAASLHAALTVTVHGSLSFSGIHVKPAAPKFTVIA